MNALFAVFCAGEGGHGYLKDWLWWSGLLTSEFSLVKSILNVCHKHYNVMWEYE